MNVGGEYHHNTEYMNAAESLKLCDEIAKRMPELWRKCYPRIYSEPRQGRYYSPRYVAARLFEIALKIANGKRGQSELYEFQIASRLAENLVPMFFIAPGMMDAMTNTKTPSDILWLDMKLPFEAMAFLPPRETLRHETDGDLMFFGYARFEQDKEEKSVLDGRAYGVYNGGMMFFALTDRGLFHHWNMPKDSFGERLNLTDIETLSHNLNPHNSSTGFGAIDITDQDNRLMVRVAHYVFSSLLIMLDRPAMVEMGRLEKRVSRRGEQPKEFWEPNVIGKGYVVKREVGVPVGEHASPRLHFVRGFWRQQVHGSGRLLRRTQWIEPFIRGM